MASETQEHWENKVICGIGTMKEFVQVYELVNASKGQFAVTSTLFLTGNSPVDDSSGTLKLGIYEWVIYYKRNPNINKTIDSATNKIVDGSAPQLSLD